MDAALHDFLRNPSWDASAHIIEQYSQYIPDFRLKMIAKHQNEMILDMLCDLLQPIAASQKKPDPPKLRAKKAKKPPKRAKAVYELPDAKDWPADLVELRSQVVRWLREQQSIHGTLQYMAYETPDTDGGKMYQYCERMVKVEDQLQDAYMRLDYFKSNKKYLPGTEPMSQSERMKYLLKWQPRDVSYIRRFKNSKDDKVQKELSIRSQRIAEIKSIIDG